MCKEEISSWLAGSSDEYHIIIGIYIFGRLSLISPTIFHSLEGNTGRAASARGVHVHHGYDL